MDEKTMFHEERYTEFDVAVCDRLNIPLQDASGLVGNTRFDVPWGKFLLRSFDITVLPQLLLFLFIRTNIMHDTAIRSDAFAAVPILLGCITFPLLIYSAWMRLKAYGLIMGDAFVGFFGFLLGLAAVGFVFFLIDIVQRVAKPHDENLLRVYFKELSKFPNGAWDVNRLESASHKACRKRWHELEKQHLYQYNPQMAARYTGHRTVTDYFDDSNLILLKKSSEGYTFKSEGMDYCVAIKQDNHYYQMKYRFLRGKWIPYIGYGKSGAYVYRAEECMPNIIASWDYGYAHRNDYD